MPRPPSIKTRVIMTRERGIWQREERWICERRDAGVAEGRTPHARGNEPRANDSDRARAHAAGVKHQVNASIDD
eukprot:11731294-Alexandrium_andersonii.AAC.1